LLPIQTLPLQQWSAARLSSRLQTLNETSEILHEVLFDNRQLAKRIVTLAVCDSVW
jgi:hypothetical protein